MAGQETAVTGCRVTVVAQRALSSLGSFATVDPAEMSASAKHVVPNLVGGEWVMPAATSSVLDPLNGEEFMVVADTSPAEIGPFVASLAECSKSGLHNPLKNPERYRLYGDVSARAAALLREKTVEDFFVHLIQVQHPRVSLVRVSALSSRSSRASCCCLT